MAGFNEPTQRTFPIYQGKPPPGTLARPQQPHIVERGFFAGETLRPGWGVKYNYSDYSDYRWYLADDSEGAEHTITDLATAGVTALNAAAALGDYVTIGTLTGGTDPQNNIFYQADGTTAYNNDNSITAGWEFRYVTQAANTNRWVRTSAGSQVGVAGQYAVPRHSDRANLEGIVYYDPTVVPQTASSTPAGSNSPDYIEFAAGDRIQVAKFGAINIVAGAALTRKARVEFDPGDNKNWVIAPATPRTNLRATIEALEAVASGQIAAVRTWGPRY